MFGGFFFFFSLDLLLILACYEGWKLYEIIGLTKGLRIYFHLVRVDYFPANNIIRFILLIYLLLSGY